MALITGHDLIEAGYTPGPQFPELLAAAAAYENRGITDREYVLKLLRKHYAQPPPKVTMRAKAASFTEAIAAATAEEEANVSAVRRQMTELMRSPVLVRGSLMPDACPAGSAPGSIPVGGAIAARNAIIPAAHSADICCSMFATFYVSQSPVETELDALSQITRFGMGGRRPDDLVHHPVIDEEVWTNRFLCGLRETARIHMADQGDGNHFAYLGEATIDRGCLEMLREAGYGKLAEALRAPAGAEAGTPESNTNSRTYRVLVTHHGSRGLGAHVYKRGQIAACKHTARAAAGIPAAAAWIDASSEEGSAYWEALQYVARWTRANHETIHARFLGSIGKRAAAELGNEHNFVWRQDDLYLHGKGATPAWRDAEGRPLLGLIPLNMAAPILLVLGRGNDEFLSFAPHGAGRNLSRTALKRRFPDAGSRFRAIEEGTDGIDVRWFCGQADLSETPVAYKDASQVREQIERFSLAKVVSEIRPLGCIMAGEFEGTPPWRRRQEELTPKQKRQIEHRAGRRKNRQELRGER